MASILFIRGGALGDFLLTLPAIRLAVTELPGAEVEVLGYRPHVNLAESFGLAARTRSMEHGPMSEMFIPGRGATAKWRDWFASFSVVISYLKDDDGIFADNLRACGVKTLLLGLSRVDEFSDQHASLQFAAPLEKIGLFADLETFSAPFIKADGVTNTLAIHPGSGGVAKTWAPENWAALGGELHRIFPAARLLLVTGEVERERGVTEIVQTAWDGLPWEHADSLPLPELTRRLRNCRFYVGNDSGASHLAAACGTRSLVLFGPTNSALWAPPQPNASILRAELGRMEDIRVDQVLRKVENLID